MTLQAELYTGLFLAAIGYAMLKLLQGRYERVLLLLALSIPFRSIYLQLGGVYLEVWKLLSLLLLPFVVAAIARGRLPRAGSPVLLFVLYMVLSTLLFTWTTQPLQTDLDTFKGVMRPIAQVGQMLAFLNLMFVFYFLAERPATAMSVARAYVIGVVISVALAALQAFMELTAGINLFPIPRLSGELQQDVSIYLAGERAFRLSALSMEPKNLAVNVVSMLVVLMEFRTRSGRWLVDKRLAWMILPLALLVLYYTYSSLGFMILAAYAGFRALRYLRPGPGLLKISVLSLVLLLGFALLSDRGPGRILEIIQTRTIDRIYDQHQGLKLEDYDEATLGYFGDHPLRLLIGVGFGNLHNLAGAYLPAYSLFYARDAVWMPKAGLLYLLSGAGMLGLGLLAWYFATLLRERPASREESALRGLLLFFMLILLVRYNVQVFLFAGLLLLSRRKEIPCGGLRT